MASNGRMQFLADKCRMSCSDNFFTVLDTVSTYNQLEIKEALHIMWEKPILNKQVKHCDTSLSFSPLPFSL